MKALLHTEPFTFRYTDVEDPSPGPDDVLVRVRACGICGSDVHGYSGESGRRIPPVIMGHEAAGVVERVGERVTQFAPGDRVCFDSTVYCNACDACLRGQFNRCDKRQVLGVSVPAFRRNGAMAEYVVIPRWITAAMPDGLSFKQAALLEPVAIAVHAVNQAKVARGDTVFIIGAGTIGLFLVQAARLKDAGQIIVSDLDDFRLSVASELGAHTTVNAAREDVVQKVRENTRGRGADVSIEAVGFQKTLHQAVQATRMGGRVTLVGNLQKKVELDLQDLVSREITLTGSYASSGEYRECIDLVVSGRIDVDRIVSEVLPLSEGQGAFDRLYGGKENLLKIVLEP